MENLKKITYIAVFAVSIMAMIYMGNANSRQFSWECDKAKDMAATNLRQAYNYPDPDNKILERAEGYSAYYSAFCKP